MSSIRSTTAVDASGDYPILRLASPAGTLGILFNDVHFPIHDPGVMDVVVEATQVLKPSWVVADGDIHDYQSLSSHRRTAAQMVAHGSLAAEAEVSRPYMQAIRAAVPHCIYKRGNHEERLDRLVDDNQGLFGALEWWHPVADAVEGWDCLPGDTVVQAGRLGIFHGHEIGATLGQNPARRVLNRYPGQNTYFGHCHQLDVATTPHSKHGRQVIHGAWAGGHCSDTRKQSYAAAFRDRWQHGFGVVEYFDMEPDPEHGRAVGFLVHLVRVFKDSRGMPVARVLGKTLRGN